MDSRIVNLDSHKLFSLLPAQAPAGLCQQTMKVEGGSLVSPKPLLSLLVGSNPSSVLLSQGGLFSSCRASLNDNRAGAPRAPICSA